MQTFFLCPALHKITITDQCSNDELWIALINQLDKAACGIRADEKKIMRGLGPSWVGEQISELINSGSMLFYLCIWCAQVFMKKN